MFFFVKKTKPVPPKDSTTPLLFSECQPLPLKYLDWADVESIVAVVFSCVGILITSFVTFVFIQYRDTPVVKSSSRELCYIILAGIFLGYICPFTLIARPTVASCYLQRLLVGLSAAMCYSALVTKTNRIARILAGSKKKTWNFIHEKMSYDTFFTMKRLIERSRRPDEVLRWVTQNPSKISHNHYPVALQKIGQLLQATPPPQTTRDATDTEASGGGLEGDGRQILEHQDFQTLCNAIVNDCAKFDNFSIVNCLYAVAALGESLHAVHTHPTLTSLNLVCSDLRSSQ